jgi:PEP-CTERM motif
MKTNPKFIAYFCCFFGAFVHSGTSQTFQDLDFEDAVIVPDPSSIFYPNAVYASDALPGWTVTGGFMAGVQGDIGYNEVSLGAPYVGVSGINGSPPALDGAYSLNLYGGSVDVPTGVSISQTGLVPADAESISFIAVGPPPFAGGSLMVSLGGQNISFSVLSSGAKYDLYGGNIPSELDGQSEQLTISAPEGNNNYWEIDDIQFSALPVPEPNSLGLFALGGLLMACRQWRRNR